MENNANVVQLQHVELLSQKDIENIQLFIDFLVRKQKITFQKVEKTKPKKLLFDMERIAIPVNNIIINREDIYNKRF